MLVSDIPFSSPGTVSVSVTGSLNVALPVYFPTDAIFLGDLTIGTNTPTIDLINFSLADVNFTIPTFDLSNIGLYDGILLAVDGIDLFLGGIQDVLDGEVFGITLPLIGDSLSDGARFIEDLRNGFLDDFRTAIENFTDPDENIVRILLFDLLGPSGIDLLLDSDDSGTDITLNDIGFSTADIGGKEAVQWNFVLGDTLVNAGADIGLDIGIPGLGLETEGSINMVIDWEFAFGFGLSLVEGFFFDISDGSELQININVTLPDVVITGRLGFLQLEATDNGSRLGATFGVNIINRSDAADTRLSFGELGSFGLTAGLAAEAIVDLGLVVALNSDLVPGAASIFPTIEADFFLDWSIGDRSDLANVILVPFSAIGNAMSTGLQLVEFTNVALNAGEFFSDFLGPIIGQIQDIIEPIQPIIDFVTAPLPVISDLGPPVTLLDLAATFGVVDARMISAIRAVITIIDLIDGIPADTAVIIPFGDFTIFDSTNSSLQPDLTARNADLSGITTPDDGVSIASKASALSSSSQTGGSQTGNLLSKLTTGSNAGLFALPILTDPSQIFGLLLGRTATLVTIDLPPLEFGFQFKKVFPLAVFPPLQVFIKGSVSFTIDLAFGFDTFGIQKFVDSGFRNPELIFDGFYISDRENADGTGRDVPELVFNASLTAGAQLSIVVATAGVEGGIFVTINFDLFDPNGGRGIGRNLRGIGRALRGVFMRRRRGFRR